MARKYEIEMALNMLTEGSVMGTRSKVVQESAFSAQSFAAASVKEYEKARSWTTEKGVQGFGIANKISEGKKTGELALKVYVDKKRPLKDIDSPCPKYVDLPAIGKLSTDVDEIGELKPQSFTTRSDPARPGTGVMVETVADDVGTFGCVVENQDPADTQKYMLSNLHVLAAKGSAPIGSDIYQPGTQDGGTANDIIGQLNKVQLFDFDQSSFPNLADAAIARLDPAARGFTENIRILEHPPLGVGAVVRRGMHVHKVGRTTDFTMGQILDTNFRFYMPYSINGQVQRVGFRDQVLCTLFTQGGDSGAAVLNSSEQIIGLHFAGSASNSVFNKIQNVFDVLQIKLPD